MRKNIPFKGFITGMLLQLAIGPVFVFILNIAFQEGIVSGIAAVLAVTLVDYLYILLAIIGVGKLLETPKFKNLFGVLSSLVLFIFGVMLIKKGILFADPAAALGAAMSPTSAFAAAFVLTFSSPLTIIFWTSVFANKTIEYSLNKKELFVFGISAGAATFVFLGCAVSILSVMKMILPVIVFQILNVFAGLILILFAFTRFAQIFFPNRAAKEGTESPCGEETPI